jgi:hypothetical protein
LQTGQSSGASFLTGVVVDDVRVTNAGTKAISATLSKKVTITNCYAEVNAYTAAENPAATTASSGSCFESNSSHDVVFNGKQVGSTIKAPGIRLINGSTALRVFGNTIEGASYLGFIQNADDVDFFANTGRDIAGNAIFIGDSDADQPTDTCKRVRVHHNTIIDPSAAFVTISANKDGYNAYVETYIYENDFVQISGTPTHGIYNNGVIAPAIGGECLVYQWNNTFTGTIPNQLSGPAVAEIMPEPNQGWRILAQSAVSVAHTGDTAEHTFVTVTLPANTLGKNGRLRITPHWSFTNNANNKTTRVRVGGSSVFATTLASKAQQRVQIDVCNVNSASSQKASVFDTDTGLGSSATAVTLTTINTASASNIQIKGTLANAADTISMEGYLIEYYYEN